MYTLKNPAFSIPSQNFPTFRGVYLESYLLVLVKKNVFIGDSVKSLQAENSRAIILIAEQNEVY